MFCLDLCGPDPKRVDFSDCDNRLTPVLQAVKHALSQVTVNDDLTRRKIRALLRAEMAELVTDNVLNYCLVNCDTINNPPEQQSLRFVVGIVLQWPKEGRPKYYSFSDKDTPC